jgi:hypothetical protein
VQVLRKKIKLESSTKPSRSHDGVPEESFWTTVLSIAYSAIIHQSGRLRLPIAPGEP